jgi:hypothetical protein
MAVGLPAKTTYVDGDVFSASDINDTNGTLNLVGQTTNFYAGKNKIINGDFSINQRSFSTTSTTSTYGFDRWIAILTDGTTNSYSAQTFTPGAAPIAGYEAANYARLTTAGQTASNAQTSLRQRIESVRTFAGQTATFSFFAKANSGTPSIALEIAQFFGSGGSATVNTFAGKVTLSTSWARYSITVAIPSISGKTVGTGSDTLIDCTFFVSAGTNFDARTGSLGIQSNTFDVWGFQAEAGSTATAFQTATGTIQGELAACQRYYFALAGGNLKPVSFGTYYTSSTMYGLITFPVTMRTAPSIDQVTGTDYYKIFSNNNGGDGFNSLTIDGSSTQGVTVYNNAQVSGTAGQSGWITTGNNASLLSFTSEL